MDLRRAQRPRQPAGPGPAGAGAAPRRRGRGGDRAQPGLDGRRPRGLQGRRRVPADRAALPGRPHRGHAVAGRVRAGADRDRQHRPRSTRPSARCRGSRRVFIDAAYAEDHADGDLGVDVAPDQLAYIYFTSGSTGEPKGAMCEHAGMLNHLYAKIDDLEIGDGQVVAQTAPQCFDISLWQLVSALLAGGRTLLVEQEVILDVERFVDTIAGGRVTRPAGRAVLPRGRAVLPGAAPPRAAGPAVRVGHRRGAEEGAHPALVRRPARDQAGQRVRADRDLGRHQPRGDGPGPGRRAGPARPARQQRARLRRRRATCRRCRSARPGAIVFSGVCVGRGYINDPERTRLAFMPDPHRPGERLYRAGDYGRWRPDGKLEYPRPPGLPRSRSAASGSRSARSRTPCCACPGSATARWWSPSAPARASAWSRSTPARGRSTPASCGTGSARRCPRTWSRRPSTGARACR